MMFSTWGTSWSVPAIGLVFATAAEGGRGVHWWVWLLILLVPLALAIWWWLSKSQRQTAPPIAPAITLPEVPSDPATAVPVAAPTAEAPTPEMARPDDLTLIEGIGPKISRLFQEAGIATFAQLAAADVEHLRQLLLDAKLRLANPETWPDQARLAAAGDWAALEALQADLKGGRRE